MAVTVWNAGAVAKQALDLHRLIVLLSRKCFLTWTELIIFEKTPENLLYLSAKERISTSVQGPKPAAVIMSMQTLLHTIPREIIIRICLLWRPSSPKTSNLGCNWRQGSKPEGHHLVLYTAVQWLQTVLCFSFLEDMTQMTFTEAEENK